MTSSSTMARTCQEAFFKGEGATRSCPLAHFGLLAPIMPEPGTEQHRGGWPGGLESLGDPRLQPLPPADSGSQTKFLKLSVLFIFVTCLQILVSRI